MTPELYGLEQQLKQNARAKATGLGMDEQFAAAEALRDAPKTEGYRGYVSPMSIIADTIGQNTGKRQLRELASQREANRMAQAENASALPMYQAQRELTNTNQAQTNVDNQAEAKVIAVEQAGLTRAREAAQKHFYDMQMNDDKTAATTAKAAASARNDYSAGAETEARKHLTMLGKLNGVKAATKDFSGETIERLNSDTERAKKIVVGGAANMMGPSAKTFVSSWLEKDPAVKNYFQQLSALSAVERHALFGGALSQREEQSANEFIASVMALPFDEQMTRLARLQESSEQGITNIDNAANGTRFLDTRNKAGYDTLYPPEEGWSITEVGE